MKMLKALEIKRAKQNQCVIGYALLVRFFFLYSVSLLMDHLALSVTVWLVNARGERCGGEDEKRAKSLASIAQLL